MKKKLLALVLCLVMVTVAVVALVACDDGDYDYKITVWVGEGTKEFTEDLIKEFNKTNADGIKFKATVQMVSEKAAAGDVISKPQSAADIFCFAQDQLARLVQSGMLAPLNTPSQTFITENNTASSVKAAEIGGTIRAFPLTADNGYFMYYDKRVVSEDHIGSLEEILADCKDKSKNFSMNLAEDGGAWYAASFFYAMGCQSEWETNDNGTFKSYNDTFNSDNGILALKAMKKVLDCGFHMNSDKVADFTAGTPSGVVISGIWDYNAAKKALGTNLGVAPLPSFTDANGQSHQLKTYLGHKLMGVSQQSDGRKSYYLQQLAAYLTGEQVQLARFNKVGWGPTNINLQDNQDVLNSEALKVIANSATMLQGQYPTNWWTQVVLMAGKATNDKTSTKGDAELQAALKAYADKLTDLKNGVGDNK